MSNLFNKNKFFLFAILLVFGVLFFLLNIYTPLSFKDDLGYSFSFATGEPITSINQIFESQLAHYNIINGRFVVHTIEQLLLLAGKPIFNIANTLIFLLFGMLVTYHITGQSVVIHPALLLCVFCLIMLITPCFAEDLLWVSGACNYLFGFTICLLYLLPYRAAFTAREKTYKTVPEIFKALGMLILGIVAGNTMENAGVALIATTVAYLVFYRVNRIKIRAWMLMPGTLLGLSSLLLAPGEITRLGTAGPISIGSILTAFFSTSMALVVHYYPLLLLQITTIYIYIGRQQQSKAKLFSQHVINWQFTIIYFVGALAATFSMIVVPGGIGIYSRIWFGPQTFYLILLGTSYILVRDFIIEHTKALGNILVCSLFIATLVVSVQGLWNVRNRFYENENRFIAAQEQLKAGEKVIKIPGLSSTSRFSIYFSGGEHLYYDASKNETAATYYGLPEIIRDDSLIHP